MSAVSEFVNERIQKRLAEGRVPWFETMGNEQIEPHSYSTKKPYSGTTLLLAANRMMDENINGYAFIAKDSLAKAKELNSRIGYKSGASLPTMITYWQPVEIPIEPEVEKDELEKDVESAEKRSSHGEEEEETEEEEVETKTVPMLRYYYVFNSDQLTNYKKINEFNNEIVEQAGKRDGYALAEETLNNNKVAEIVESSKTDEPKYDVDDQVLYVPDGADRNEDFYYSCFQQLAYAASLDHLGYDQEDSLKNEVIQDMSAWVLCNRCAIMNGVSVDLFDIDTYINDLNDRLEVDSRFMVSTSSRAKNCVNVVTDGVFMSPENRLEETPTGQLVDPDQSDVAQAQAKALQSFSPIPLGQAKDLAEAMGMEKRLEKSIAKLPEEKQAKVTDSLKDKFRADFVSKVEPLINDLNDSMQSGDFDKLTKLLHPKNEPLRNLFSDHTGVFLGDSKKDIEEVLEELEYQEEAEESEGVSV